MARVVGEWGVRGAWQDMGPEGQAGTRVGKALGLGRVRQGALGKPSKWASGRARHRAEWDRLGGVKDHHASSRLFLLSRNVAVIVGGRWEQAGMTLQLCETHKLQ